MNMNTDLANNAAYDIMVELNLFPDTRMGSRYPSQMDMWDKMTEIIANHYRPVVHQREMAIRALQRMGEKTVCHNCSCAGVARRTIQQFRTEPEPKLPKQVGRILDL